MIFVDSADKADLSHALSLPYVTGFTTNPSLFVRALGVEILSPSEYVSYALSLVAVGDSSATVRDFMIQGFGAPEQVLAQAMTYRSALRDEHTRKLWIKLLPTAEHLALCPKLASLGCRTLITAVFTPLQAHAAMESGADGVAVYLGRLMKNEESWERKVEMIYQQVRPREKMLLMASLPDLSKAEAALRYSDHITVPYAVLEQLLHSPLSRDAISTFALQVEGDEGRA